MSDQLNSKRISRRGLVRGVVFVSLTASVPLLQACGGAAPPPTATSVPAKPTAAPPPSATPAPAKPTTAPPPTATQAAAKPTAAPPTATPATKASGTPKEGGTLRAAFQAVYENFNPMRLQGAVRIDTSKRIFSALVQYDETFTMASDLAEKWDISSDAKTYTFKLRNGVKFHDGAPCTAKDVLFTMHLQANNDTGGVFAKYVAPVKGAQDYTAKKADRIAGITAVDDYTVKFELENPTSSFISNLAKLYIVPEHLLKDVSPADLNKSKFMVEEPIGTGPFKLTKYILNKGYEYERNPNFHLGKPKIEKMVWDIIPSRDAILVAMEKGEIDYSIYLPWDAENFKRIKGNKNLQIAEHYQPRADGLLINSSLPAFGDKRVRQALAYALDRKSLLELTAGMSILHENFFNVPWAKNPNLKWSQRYPFDLARAKQMLQEAKWDSSYEVPWIMGGKPGDGTLLVQEMLATAGVKTKLITMDTAPLVKGLYTDRDFGFYFGGVAYEDPWLYATKFTCDEGRPGGLSWCKYCNPKYEELMKQEAAATTVEARGKVYHALEEILFEDVLHVLLIYSPIRAAFSKRVHVPRWTWYVHDYSWEWWIE